MSGIIKKNYVQFVYCKAELAYHSNTTSQI